MNCTQKSPFQDLLEAVLSVLRLVLGPKKVVSYRLWQKAAPATPGRDILGLIIVEDYLQWLKNDPKNGSRMAHNRPDNVPYRARMARDQCRSNHGTMAHETFSSHPFNDLEQGVLALVNGARLRPPRAIVYCIRPHPIQSTRAIHCRPN